MASMKIDSYGTIMVTFLTFKLSLTRKIFMPNTAIDDRYACERTVPTVGSCMQAPFRLIFDGGNLRAIWSKKLIMYRAASGRPDAKGNFDYSLARQKIPNEGPIPEGNYWINPAELQKNAWWRFRNPHDAWGNFWLTIHPYPTTDTYKRGGFFIHGGSQYGSAGCIDLSYNMKRFVEVLRSELKTSNCYIPLEVRYPK
ncbi:MAG: DUF2778 domain-containing protein [Desulfobulbaceae bacterium]|nr:DUF2778 domain-containing protein [Desulfobulbaceae bacterium]